MKKIHLSLILIFFFSLPAFSSQALAGLFNQANQFYQKGEFEKAKELYQKLISSGIANSDLYYNLANSYYQLGEVGEAMLWWWRAEKLAPRDPDLRYNLNLVQSQLEKKLELGSSKPGFFFAFERIRDLANSREWGIIFSACLWLFWLGLALRILLFNFRAKRFLNLLLIVILLLGIFSGLGFGFRLHREKSPYAIVMNSGVELRSGPGETFSRLALLPEGFRVLIQDCSSGYCRVKLGSGIVGWVKGKNLEKI